MNAPGNVVQAWLRRARSDLELARIALEARSVLPEDACFHAQQCAEKALKAFLLQAGDDPPRTHAIDVLLDRLKVRGICIPDSVDSAFTLSEYAVQTRYSGEWEPVTAEEAYQAVAPGYSGSCLGGRANCIRTGVIIRDAALSAGGGSLTSAHRDNHSVVFVSFFHSTPSGFNPRLPGGRRPA